MSVAINIDGNIKIPQLRRIRNFWVWGVFLYWIFLIKIIKPKKENKKKEVKDWKVLFNKVENPLLTWYSNHTYLNRSRIL